MCKRTTRMRFKRGSKVEVFRTDKVPSGSWYSADIVHGNGHYYTVKYDEEIEDKIERVPRKAIRPCPPSVQVLDWTSGQLVEVFHCFSWKIATVLRVLQRDWLLVRLIGSCHELEVKKVDIRPRLCWQDDEWKVIGKGSSNCEERHDVPLKPSILNFKHMEIPASICYYKNPYSALSNINNIPKTRTIPSQSLKRKLTNMAYELPSQKTRVIAKNSRKIQFQLPEKVDAFDSSQAMMDRNWVPSFDNKLTGFSRSFVGRGKVDGGIGCSSGINLELNNADSIVSSVASCSSSGKIIYRGFLEDSEYNSDAESFCRMMESGEGNSLPLADENLAADETLMEDIHRIELHAYRSTIEALHASGPLSWEQETLLTNLRDSLHVTNDEHLIEVRNLLSSSNSSPDS